MAGSERHLIKKYANRKLYDTRTSRYITLEGIAQLISEGADVEVVDRESGRDLTPVVLSQTVLSEERRGGQQGPRRQVGRRPQPVRVAERAERPGPAN